ncbi:MAG: hypothetical protein INH41_17530 [Myxococcaceae bacterium]|nr:hypothetical protein [Myxococcaceae bacterium]MCA3014186.1 hypothetical protein [Myxococcaceae bacterium]
MRWLFLSFACVCWCGCEPSADVLEPGLDAPPPDEEALAPGWYDVPRDPTVLYGRLPSGVLRGTMLEGRLELEAAAPAGRYEVSVVWTSAATEQVLGVATPGAPGVGARLQPPPAALEASTCPGGQRARGVLFVRHVAEAAGGAGTLVGASAVRSAVWTATEDAFVAYDECATEPQRLNPVTLWTEPRLALAHCAAMRRACQDSDGVRLWDATLHVEGDTVRLTENPVFGEAQALRVEVNGQPLVPDSRGLVRRSDFRPGRNRVTWWLGARPPYEATVVLPPPLRLSATPPLRANEAFTLSAADAGWAQRFLVNVHPLPIAPRQAPLFFESETLPLTGVFTPFPQAPAATRARVSVLATKHTGRFVMALGETLEVEVAR